MQGERGKRLGRLRCEYVERTFAHLCETGAARRSWLRGLEKVKKRYLMHAAGRNLGVILRAKRGIGTPRSLQDGLAALCAVLQHALCGLLKPVARFCGLGIATELEDTDWRDIFAPGAAARAAA